ncbi:MAG: cbb3-type cytochrome c oxidase subunit I [Haloplanus sp.]
MIFLVVVPAGGAFGNMLIPKMIGADEMAFPRLNAFGAWILFAGGILLWWPAVTYLLNLTGLPFYGGWFGYTPMSTTLTTVGARTWPISVIVLTFGTTGTAINFLVTVLNERDPDMSLLDMPIFIWGAGIITPILTLYGLPWLTAGMGMAYFETTFDVGFFNPALGGAPVLYQHLFWLFGHPEVYIVIIPVFTAVLTILPRFSGRPLWGRNVVISALLWIMLASCLVWAHHMFTSGLQGIRLAFMFTTLSIALAFSLILFAMAATIWKGRIVLRTPMIFAIGFILMLIISGLDGIMLALPPYNMIVHDTWFVVGHFHFTLFGGSIMGMFAAIYYWYPLATGRMYNELLGKVHAATTIVAAPTVFFLMGKLGEHGMIRRYAAYTFAPELQTLHVLTTAFAYLLGASQVVMAGNLLYSLRYGEEVTNPWDDLLAGQGMPSPEWPGEDYELPHNPPTPSNVTHPGPTEESSSEAGGDD